MVQHRAILTKTDQYYV